jgi:hypothetical protein
MAELIDKGTHYEVAGGRGGGFMEQLQRSLPTILTLMMRNQQTQQLRQNRAAQLAMNYAGASPDVQKLINQSPAMMKVLEAAGMNIPKLDPTADPFQSDPTHGWDPEAAPLMPSSRLPISDYTAPQKQSMMASRASQAASGAQLQQAEAGLEKTRLEIDETIRSNRANARLVNYGVKGFQTEAQMVDYMQLCYNDSEMTETECLTMVSSIATGMSPDYIADMQNEPGNPLSTIQKLAGKGNLIQLEELRGKTRMELINLGIPIDTVNTYVAMQSGVITGEISPIVLSSWMRGIDTDQFGAIDSYESRKMFISLLDAGREHRTMITSALTSIHSMTDRLEKEGWLEGVPQKVKFQISKWYVDNGIAYLNGEDQVRSFRDMDQAAIDELGMLGISGQEMHRNITEAHQETMTSGRIQADMTRKKEDLQAVLDASTGKLTLPLLRDIFTLLSTRCPSVSSTSQGEFDNCINNLAPGITELMEERTKAAMNIATSTTNIDPSGVLPTDFLRQIVLMGFGASQFAFDHLADIAQAGGIGSPAEIEPGADKFLNARARKAMEEAAGGADQLRGRPLDERQREILEYKTARALVQQQLQVPDGINPQTFMTQEVFQDLPELYRATGGTVSPGVQASRTRKIWNIVVEEAGADYGKAVANSLGITDPALIENGNFITEEFVKTWLADIEDVAVATPVLTETTTADDLEKIRPLLPVGAIMEGNVTGMTLAVQQVQEQLVEMGKIRGQDSDFMQWSIPMYTAIKAFDDDKTDANYAAVIDAMNRITMVSQQVVPNAMRQQRIAPQFNPAQAYLNQLRRGRGPDFTGYKPDLQVAGTPEERRR